MAQSLLALQLGAKAKQLRTIIDIAFRPSTTENEAHVAFGKMKKALTDARIDLAELLF